MTQTYEYNGFTVQVAVESGLRSRPTERASAHPGYVAVVRICEAGSAVPRLSPLRLGEAGGHPFDSEADALNGGYIAACTIVDDLFGQDIAGSFVMPLRQSAAMPPSPGVLLSFGKRAQRPENEQARWA
ncbi:hypothetical protein [Paraburkholderia tuberum]|uniref:Uncharacterized protein n=1 Tax=Paraburkholderia tuberum TaxID=157910 RepID=A0A1H1KIZ2_9BURK|nr:hypothetical protein [Paraburkholderia tuberum]SDR61745.1 hypothetical protein SAMN05445850_7938 [Paraburkholderia tuberum]